MPKASLKIEGLSEMNRELNRIADRVRREISREAVDAGAEVIREEMSLRARRAPRATRPGVGHLADNIVKTRRTDAHGATAEAGPSKAAFWGRFLELGTAKMRAFPFARPAWDSRSREALDELVKALSDGIQRSGRSR